MQRLTDTTEIPTYVEVHEDHLTVDVGGQEKMLSFKSRLHIPLEHVNSAEADPQIEHTLWRGWRIPGVHLLTDRGRSHGLLRHRVWEQTLPRRSQSLSGGASRRAHRYDE